jgi:hypothetical protein
MRVQPVPTGTRPVASHITTYHRGFWPPEERASYAGVGGWREPARPHGTAGTGAGPGGEAGPYGAQISLAWSTSSRICSTRASTESNRRVPRSRTAKSIAACRPYRSRSVRSSAYASTVRT